MLDHEKVADLEFYNWFLAALATPKKTALIEKLSQWTQWISNVMDAMQKPENRAVKIARVKQNGMKTMSKTKTITVRKDLVYNVDLIKKTLADQACFHVDEVAFEDALEFARNLSLLDMSDNPSSGQYLDFLDDEGNDLYVSFTRN